MKKFFLASMMSVFLLTSCDVVQQVASNLIPSNLETVSALKTILNSSTFKAIKTIKDVNDHGVAGVLPEEVRPVLNTLKTLGLGKEIAGMEKDITRISGIALKESQATLADAVKNLKFKDAVSVVTGGEGAATEVLKQAMYKTVKQRYSSQLQNELNKTDITKYWPLAAGAYNALSKKKVSNNLSDLLAEKAVDGLFMTMSKEESKIRKNYRSLGDQVVTKVFDYYKNRK